MNNLQIFSNEEFGEIRTAGTPENPLFCLADVCRALELRVDNVTTRLKGDPFTAGVISQHPITDKLGRTQNANFVNEDGLYDVILDSRKPEAKKFRKWITSEVLPTIRKTGGYLTPEKLNELFSNPDAIIKLCQEWKAALVERDQLRNIVDMQAVAIAELTPKASYYDLILQSTEALPISVIAKDYGYSGCALNKLLNEMQIQYKLKSGVWLVYQNYAEKGYTRTQTFTLENGGSVTHTYWTQKGRLFLYEMLKRRGIIPLIEQDDSEKALLK